ncbi:MAG TPA: Na+/H+ antiporter subunit E [Candidatus Methylomirabilis sp.]|nr:Na+/H+ antiporter subunit E [Candidatus Methylomirabilis sp.]
MLRRVGFAFTYLIRFLKELTLANYQVAKLVLSPAARLRPGFVAVPLTARTDFEITSFANSITLTPGTISVFVPEDRQVIVMHAIDVGDDLDALRQTTKDSLEAPILRVTR